MEETPEETWVQEEQEGLILQMRATVAVMAAEEEEQRQMTVPEWPEIQGQEQAER